MYIILELYFGVRCGLKEECVGAVEPLQWLPYNSVSCPAVGAVLPQQTQINKQSTTQVCIVNLMQSTV